jgi:hypothetical protein
MSEPCGHCGFRGPIEHKGDVVLRVDHEYEKGIGRLEFTATASVFLCPACHEPSIWHQVWLDAAGEFVRDRRIYPTIHDNGALPEKVRARLDAALRVKKFEPSAYAVLIRRMLETVCNEEGATGKDLFSKLDDLVAKGRMPQQLADVAHQLREVGNLGAHDDEVEVDAKDVPLIEDLAEAILEYLYRAPAKLAAVKQGIENRKQGKTDDWW